MHEARLSYRFEENGMRLFVNVRCILEVGRDKGAPGGRFTNGHVPHLLAWLLLQRRTQTRSTNHLPHFPHQIILPTPYGPWCVVCGSVRHEIFPVVHRLQVSKAVT